MSEMKYRQVSLYALSLQRPMKIYTTLLIYAIIFGLTRFGIDDPWPQVSSVVD